MYEEVIKYGVKSLMITQEKTLSYDDFIEDKGDLELSKDFS